MAKAPLNKQTARKIVGDMSNTKTMFWVIVAAGIHLVLIVGTSVGYIRDRWIDPAGVESRQKTEAEKMAAAQSPATKPTTTQPVAKAAPVKTASQIAADEEKKILELKKDNPVVKGITEPAKPGEIPKGPTRNGFDLDEALK